MPVPWARCGARRCSAAQRLGFDETRAGELALLATEVSRNVLVHGGGGQVVLAGMTEGRRGSLARILAMDQGPGIANVAQAMSDGFSTAGTMGGGMGAMKRMATTLEIFTGKSGTIVLLEAWQEDSAEATLQIAGSPCPIPENAFCGDAWCYHQHSERTLALLADGLGHGWEAAEAAQEAVATFQKRVELAPAQILSYIHDALRKTRGAVAAIAEIRPKEKTLIYAGVGNISGVLSAVAHRAALSRTTARWACCSRKSRNSDRRLAADCDARDAFRRSAIEVGSLGLRRADRAPSGGHRRRTAARLPPPAR